MMRLILVLLVAAVFMIPSGISTPAHALVCGDSEPDPGEECDDGNTTSGDGCSSTCTVENGFVCTEAIAGDPTQNPPVPPVPSQCFVQLDCTNAVDIACGQTVTGDTSAGVNSVGAYCDSLFAASGPELVYTFTLAAEMNVSAVMEIAGGANLDLYLLGSCNQLDCIDDSRGVTSTETVGGCLPAGTYYLVADGVGPGDVAGFTLSLSCQPCGPTSVEESTWGVIKSVYRD